jgi:hypothetical protein
MALSFPWGTLQTLSYGGITLTLSYANLVFRPSGNDSILSQVGCDRFEDPESLPSFTLNYSGATHKDGPPYRAPYKYAWQLQELTITQLEQAKAIARLSRDANSPVRLVDRFYGLGEPTPRTRAAAGTVPVAGAPTVPGMVYFFPIFDLLPLVIGAVSRYQIGSCDAPEYRYKLDMTATEYSPDQPVIGDIA